MSSLALKARSAVIWNTGFNFFRDILQFAMMLVLVRLLSPEAYGQFGFVTSIVGFLSIFAFGNFIAHALQVKENEQTRFQEHFTAGAVLNISIFVLTNLTAIGLRFSQQWSHVSPLLHVMSVTFLLEWPCEIRRKMIEREFDWRKLRIMHSIGLVLSAGLALGMAWAGCGTYALLVPGMAATLPFIIDLFFRLHWRPTWSWSWESYKPSFNFAIARIGSGLFLASRQLLESTFLASILGFTGLGIFNRSVGLAQLFCVKIATQMVYAIYPILTRIEDREGNASRVGSLVLQAVCWTSFPLAVSLSVLSSLVVQLIYGQKWLAVAPLLPWAMAWGIVSGLFHTSYMLLLARQKQKLCLVADFLVLIGTILSLWFAMPIGMKYYLMGTTVSLMIATFFLLANLFLNNALNLAGLAKPLASGIVSVTIAAVFASTLFSAIGAFPHISVMYSFAWGITFFGCYAITLRVAFNRQIEVLIPYLPFQSYIRKLIWLPLPKSPKS